MALAKAHSRAALKQDGYGSSETTSMKGRAIFDADYSPLQSCEAFFYVPSACQVQNESLGEPVSL